MFPVAFHACKYLLRKRFPYVTTEKIITTKIMNHETSFKTATDNSINCGLLGVSQTASPLSHCKYWNVLKFMNTCGIHQYIFFFSFKRKKKKKEGGGNRTKAFNLKVSFSFQSVYLLPFVPV